MNEELNFVRDLAVILISAGVITIISRALKQPLILGYILAGFLIGPHFKYFTGISSVEAVDLWSEIGVIFMMFGLGLEFSFKKLLRVGSGALLTAGCKFVGVFLLGYIVGQALSWTSMESIFLGGLLSMSSTAIVIKSYDEMGLKKEPYSGMVFGTLVVEDLIAILLMVLLSTMAVSNKFAGGEMLFNFGKLVFFLILWFLIGIYLIPTILRKAQKHLNDEILLIVSIGLCFGMVTLASSAGFSTALGAFVMGSILAETIESENILKLVKPIKDLFGAIFFVSVGMMIDPAIIVGNWLTILILVLFVVITHIGFSAFGIIISGNGLRNAVHTGFSLAQLGEFGFIIAGVGMSLGVLRDFIYPVIIAVSVITTFTTPYMIKAATPAYNLLIDKLPDRWLKRLERSEKQGKATAEEESLWRELLKAYFLRISLYGVIILAISLGSKAYLDTLILRVLPNISGFALNLSNVSITLLLMSPFLYGLGVNSGSINKYAPKLLKKKDINKWPLLGLIFGRAFLVVGIIISTISSRFELAGWTILLLIVGGIAFVYTARRYLHHYTILEDRFFHNFHERERQERAKKPVTSSVRAKMSAYDVHIEAIELSADSNFIGKPMKDLPLRMESGANIIKIKRGNTNIIIPGGDVMLYPHDILLAVGTSVQIKKLKKMMEHSISVDKDNQKDTNFQVEAMLLDEDSYLNGKVLKETNLREHCCMVLSVIRDTETITNPSPDFKFHTGDIVWIAGDADSYKWLNG